MKTWRVYGSINLSADMLVEAESAEEAIELAHEKWPGMSDWVGSGKSGGAMCGPNQDDTDANIWASYGEPEFDRAEEEATE